MSSTLDTLLPSYLPLAAKFALVAGLSLFAGQLTSGTSVAAPEEDTPRIILFNTGALARTKAQLAAGDATLKPALDKLVADADEALKAGPFSVMQKTSTPDSGDKHDYMSVGPYWWPDPTKPNGLPYIRKDGESNPERSNNSTDSKAMQSMTGAVKSLALAYYFTGKAAYAEHAAKLLRTWFLNPATRMNPNLNYAQAIPGITAGRDIGIIDIHGWTTLLDCVAMLETSPAWRPADQQQLVTWFDELLTWLQTSPNGLSEAKQRNNHGTWYDVQVARYALFVGKPEVAKAIVEAAKTRRIAKQIEPDGSQPHELARTKSFTYCNMNLQGFFELATIAEMVNIDLWNYETHDKRGLRRALDYLAPYADAAMKWPQQQIGEADVRTVLLPVLRQGAFVYGEPRFEELIGKLPATVASDRIQLLWPKAGGK